MSGEPGVPSLPAALLERIYRQARAEFPNECCGFIVGAGEGAQLVPCENQQDRYHAVDPETYPRTAATAYTFGFADLRRFNESFESASPATIIYHSHPRLGAYFSAEDTRAAVSANFAVDYLVVDCQEHEIPEALLFRQRAHGHSPEDSPRDSYIEVARYEGAKI